MFVAPYCYSMELRLKRVVAGSSKRKLGLGPRADAVGFVVDRNWFVFPCIRHPLRVIMTMMVDSDDPRSLVFQNQSTNWHTTQRHRLDLPAPSLDTRLYVMLSKYGVLTFCQKYFVFCFWRSSCAQAPHFKFLFCLLFIYRHYLIRLYSR